MDAKARTTKTRRNNDVPVRKRKRPNNFDKDYGPCATQPNISDEELQLQTDRYPEHLKVSTHFY